MVDCSGVVGGSPSSSSSSEEKSPTNESTNSSALDSSPDSRIPSTILVRCVLPLIELITELFSFRLWLIWFLKFSSGYTWWDGHFLFLKTFHFIKKTISFPINTKIKKFFISFHIISCGIRGLVLEDNYLMAVLDYYYSEW